MTEKPSYEELLNRVRSLEESERHYRALVDESPDLIYRTNLEGRILYISSSVYRMSGYTVEEAVGMKMAEEVYLFPKERQVLLLKLRENGKVTNFEARLKRKDGSVWWASTNAHYFKDRDGKILGVEGITRDITELKSAEEALKESEEKYRHLFETAMVGMYRTRLEDGRFLAANNKLAEMMGYESVEHFVKEYVTSTHYADPNLRDELLRRLQTQGWVDDFEIEMMRTDGSTIQIALSATAYPDQGYLEGVIVDITERKRVEDALKYETEFRRVLGAIADEFITSSPEVIDDSIDRALEAIGQFVGADRSYIIHFDLKAGTISNTHEWCRTGIESQIDHLQNVPMEMFGWIIDQLTDLQVVHIPMVSELPTEADAAKREFEAEGIQSLLLVPLVSEGKCFGTVGFDFVTRPRSCSQREARLLQMSGATLSNALERKRAERALRENEEKMRTLVISSSDAIISLDTQRRLTMCNPAFLSQFGYTEDEVMGKSITLIHPSEEAFRRFGDEVYPIVREKGTWRGEWTYQSKSGSTFIMETVLSAQKLTDGSIIGYTAVMRDLTERKLVEETLLEERDVAQKYLDTAGALIMVLDAKGRITLINEMGCKILGYDEQTLIGRNFVDNHVPRRIRDEIREKFQSLWRAQVEEVDYENPIINREGQERIILWRNRLLYDDAGEYKGMISSGVDITERKRAEEEKNSLEAQLRQAQKMEALGTLAGGIAHDFNNILAAMMGYTELALYNVPEDMPIKNHLEQVLKSGVRAKNLIQQILSFSRRAEPEKKPVQIASAVIESVKLLRATLPTMIEIVQEVEAGPHTVLADPTQINQLLMNLGTNAAHAMRERGGVLKIRLEKIMLDAKSAASHVGLNPGPYAKITVSDTGEGMDKDKVERIFEPFFTTKDTGEGTGMGLSVVHGIVKAHGGEITVQSEPGKGAEFCVYLPLIETEGEEEAPIETESVPKGSEHILFVDDEELLVAIGQQMLERLGYKVTAKTSSIEALEVFKAKPDRFDLVITDQTMPKMSGLELAREILTIRPDMPVIICTGFSAQMTPDRVEAIGIRRVLMKPFVARDVAEVIREVLDEG